MATCLRTSGSLSQRLASHGFSRFVAYLPLLDVSPFVVLMVSQVPVKSLDVLLNVQRNIIPVVPILPAQICENPEWSQLISTHIYHHITSLVNIAANDSLSHQRPDGYTAHTVPDSHF